MYLMLPYYCTVIQWQDPNIWRPTCTLTTDKMKESMKPKKVPQGEASATDQVEKLPRSNEAYEDQYEYDDDQAEEDTMRQLIADQKKKAAEELEALPDVLDEDLEELEQINQAL